MLTKTHIAITIFAILAFIPVVEYRVFFALAALVATLIPDIDSPFSYLGEFKGFGFLRFFTKHRGMLHSLTLAIIFSLLLSLWIPVLAAGFFLSYSLHLLADSFTSEGVQPFWPLTKRSAWRIKTGGITEKSIFISFVLADIILFLILIAQVV